MKQKRHAKTNAVRLLVAAGIMFDTVEYEVDENNLAAEHVAEELGEDIACVFKTIVLKGEYPGRNIASSNAAGYFVCVVPGNAEVDLDKAAKACGAKKASLVPVKDLLSLTGYIRGGCSPVGMKKPFPTFFHETVFDHDKIFVSAGCRGMQIEIAPQDLVDFVGATVCDIIRE